jgi:ubiquinone/menaquinone biosynthesis C-methylase UbiE
MSTEALQKIFKTLSDSTRVRILALLDREELAVQELMDVLGMAQSRVSRHLGILREAGLLRDRREGTYVFYRFAPPREGAWHDAWELARRELASDPIAERDAAALVRVVEARASRIRTFFDSVGPEWDALRGVFNDDALRARAIAHLAPAGLTVADVGTGTGVLAKELALLGMRVVAIDHAPRRLEAARAAFDKEGITNVELRGGEAQALPLGDAEVDAAFAHMVLHYVPQPAEAIREMTRVVKPGGRVVVVDFVQHEAEWMREELGVLWLGFPSDDVVRWLEGAGLRDVRVQHYASPDLPATFVASGLR